MQDNLSQRELPALGRYLTVPGLRRFTFRIRLCLFVAIILVPALILAGLQSLRTISVQRTHIDEGLGSMLNQLCVEVEREIRGTKALLAILAGLQSLQDDDLKRFHQRASEISDKLGIQIVVHRPEPDKGIISTGVPWDRSPEMTLPETLLAAERQAIQTGQIVISDVFFAPISQRYMVSAVTPVMRNGVAKYVVSTGIPLQRIAGILENAPPGPDRVAIVLDRSNTFIARTAGSRLVEGTKINTEFLSQVSGAEGIFDASNRFGEAFHGRYRRLETTGWLVAVGVRKAALDASARSTIAYTAAAETTLFAFAIGLTYLLGGRLERRVGTLGIDRKPTREEFTLFFDSAPNGVVLVDQNGTVLLTNAPLERMFGYTQALLIGRPVEMLVPGEFRSRHAELRQEFGRNPEPRPMGAERNLLGQRKDGSTFPIEIGLYPITIRAAQYIMATVVDITERSLAAKALSHALTERDRLRRHLMRASEDERLRLSHELHDQTGQTLTAATLAVKDIEKFVEADGRQRLTKLNALLDQMGKTLHQVAWELRPASIDELGLTATLENYVSDWSDQTGIPAEFYSKDGIIDQLPDEVRTTIYRVIQEALTNIAKHASEANRVSVVVNRAGAMLQLTVDDNGDGFDLAEKLGTPSKYGSLGIPSMRERLALIGGTLEIESSEGIGTTVFARIPIEPKEAQT